MRGRWLAVALALLLLPTARADWLQSGHDAAQTGYTPEAGPAWDDVVFVHQFNVSRNDLIVSRPIVVAGSAYLVVQRDSDAHLMRVVLANASVAEVAKPCCGFIRGLASDGQAIYTLVDGGRLQAFTLAGKPLWTVPVAPLGGSDPSQHGPRFDYNSNCLIGGRLIVAAGTAYVACDAHQQALYVAAYDTRDGNKLWEYLRDGRPATTNGQGATAASASVDSLQSTVPPTGYEVNPLGLTLLGDTLVAACLVFEVAGNEGTRGSIAYGEYDALDAQGHLAWVARDGVAGDALQREGGNTGSANEPPPATGDAGHTFLELIDVQEWLPGNTGPYADRTIPIRAQGSHLEGDPSSGFALAPEGLYATSRSSVLLFDAGFTPTATYTLAGQEWAPGPLTRTGNGLLLAGVGPVGAGSSAEHGGILALQAGTLKPLWQHHFASDTRFAVADGLLVAWSFDGTLTVLGHGAASPQPVAKASTAIPAPGDLVRVDLSGSGAGLFGNVTQYRADWGDGATTEWQDSPVLEHRFATLTNVESRFSVRNAAGQTASVTQTFVVGGQPELTFLQKQFAPERQNVTFFVLGLLATALAALWGVVQIRRSHGRLRRELLALEARLRELQGHPESLDEALRGFRAHAHDLLVRRKIDQAQYLVLRERIDDLQRTARMAVVDERLAFLPHGMVKRLEAMLADSQVTGWERHHFLEALDHEKGLTAVQRNQVRGLVESWFRTDHGTPAKAG